MFKLKKKNIQFLSKLMLVIGILKESMPWRVKYRIWQQSKLIISSRLFDSDWYLKNNPDVVAAKMHPIFHYLCFGGKEKRDPNPFFNADWYVKNMAMVDDNPLLHYLQQGANSDYDPAPFFNTKLYLTLNPELEGMTPLAHYLQSLQKYNFSEEHKKKSYLMCQQQKYHDKLEIGWKENFSLSTKLIDNIVVVGTHLYPTGMGEHSRSVFRAMEAVNISCQLLNSADYQEYYKGGMYNNEYKSSSVRKLSSAINIFCINVCEVESRLETFGKNFNNNAYNIIYPTWELEKFPQSWKKHLEYFNEIWTPSQFVFNSISDITTKPVIKMNLSCAPKINFFLNRRYFVIPEDAFVFLFFFDFNSFIERKNPFSILGAFKRFNERHSDTNVKLFIKTHNITYQNSKQYELLVNKIIKTGIPREKVIIFNRTLDDNGTKNLIRCCDCFISLHRSEGFGLGLAEAMFFKKPVIATAYSGNLDFMNQSNSCLVNYTLTPVEPNAYVGSEGQIWAQPDEEHAAWYMEKLFLERDYAQTLGNEAGQHIRKHFSHRAVGLRYRNRIDQITKIISQENLIEGVKEMNN